ncbi:MAG: hypothetical protein JNM56_02175 [Planctomycetia bacterium]|nr:hypothetical protein [Planctomycetia bacterium]
MKTFFALARGLFGWWVLLLFWLREIAGWGLLAAGLWVFYHCFALMLMTPPRFIQVIPLTFYGFIAFRAGIHLLRVSAAGLICLKAQQQIDDAAPRRNPAIPTRVRLHTMPFDLGAKQR